MLISMMKRMMTVFQLNAFGSGGPQSMPSPQMMDAPMSRRKLNEMLQQAPTIPQQEAKEPAPLS